MLEQIGTEYDYRTDMKATLNNYDSEEARKQLRIHRMRQTKSKNVDASIIRDEDRPEWEKQQALKQIEMVREMKKRRMMLQSRDHSFQM